MQKVTCLSLVWCLKQYLSAHPSTSLVLSLQLSSSVSKINAKIQTRVSKASLILLWNERREFAWDGMTDRERKKEQQEEELTEKNKITTSQTKYRVRCDHSICSGKLGNEDLVLANWLSFGKIPSKSMKPIKATKMATTNSNKIYKKKH